MLQADKMRKLVVDTSSSGSVENLRKIIREKAAILPGSSPQILPIFRSATPVFVLRLLCTSRPTVRCTVYEAPIRTQKSDIVFNKNVLFLKHKTDTPQFCCSSGRELGQWVNHRPSLVLGLVFVIVPFCPTFLRYVSLVQSASE